MESFSLTGQGNIICADTLNQSFSYLLTVLLAIRFSGSEKGKERIEFREGTLISYLHIGSSIWK